MIFTTTPSGLIKNDYNHILMSFNFPKTSVLVIMHHIIQLLRHTDTDQCHCWRKPEIPTELVYQIFANSDTDENQYAITCTYTFNNHARK